jgi:hypothetical protein
MDIHGAVVEEVRVGIVAVDFEHFGDVTPSWPALDLKHNVQGVGDVGLDGAIGEFHAALEDATGETGESLFRRVGVNCREGA